MAQQQQQPVAFLKPATWGSLKFAQTLKEKLFSGKGANEAARVGKENEYVPSAAPPKVDMSHLQTLGPRRHVAQRYALQPNLNVSRQHTAPQPANSGLRGLVGPGAPAPLQQQFHVQPLPIYQQQQEPQQQRPSTPSSPTMRGRAPLGQSSNPNFVNSNIATRLPTPVRINSLPSPAAPSSSSNLAMALPKPPSPSRSLSQGGMGGSPFAGAAAASPATSTATSTGFSIPVPPPVVPGVARGPQQPPQRAAQPWATSSGGAPAARAHSSTATSRPTAAPGPERSILASVQPRNASIPTPPAPQHQQHASTVIGATLAGASGTPDSAQQPQAKTVVAMPAAPPPLISVSSAITVPALQQALQQALLAAVEKKPETFKVDNFQQLFDSMMHPGHTGKLDGPLPDELADDVKYSDNWYKHCRDWNAKNKPAEAYIAVPPAPAVVAEQAVPETPKSGLRSQWSLDEAPMSEACCRALDIAHHGLKKVLTPAHSSRSVSQAVGTPSVSRPAASSILAQRSELLDDTAASRPAPAASDRPDATPTSSTVARTTDVLESPVQDAAALPPQEAQLTATSPLVASAAGSTNASPVSAALAARALVASANAIALGTAICSTPDRPSSAFAAAAAAVGIRTAAVMALVDGHETPVVPTAAKASIRDLLSPTPTRGGAGGPPSNVTTPGGPLTPGGACSTAAPSAAATPAQAGISSSAATPTTDARRAQSASPACEVPDLSVAEARLAAAASCSEGLEQSLAVAAAIAGQQEAIAAQETSMFAAGGAAPELPAVAPVQAPQPAAAQEAIWSPNFPAVEATAGAARQYVPSPVTLMQNAPRELPTPNPAFFNSINNAPSGAANLAAAVAVVAAPQHAACGVWVQMRDPAGPSTSSAPPAVDPLNEITTGIQQLTALKHTILAEDKAVDVTGITQVLQLKMAVEQLLARTSTAAAAVTVASQAPAAPAAAPPAQEHSAQQQQQPGTPQRKLSRSASFSAFIKGIFSPKSASKAAPQAAHAAVPASPSAARAFGTSNAANLAAAAPASPAVNVPGSGAVGVQAARPASASALPRHVASPSVADRGRYAVLHQRAAARLAQAAAEPAPAATNPQVQQRGDVWRRYEEKITSHRHQLDTTKSQLDEAVRKLRDMQAEFDELLLCLGMESAKNRALCDAMLAAGIDPEPIMAAIEAEWLAGNGEQ
ncbi:hypothetical protein CHLRE_09g388100v5 [Chlamydomonas reinhardtii]|uniref:Uncharacterized protein n=1 Tax=Chlamydomonas reinhardtii TaxID=3055 RepID=A0A2K3DDR3_CHLRE|nr:uncharacterized protein CHLRE_09g388100v5 [Chlamydomonas reinhardtii]PNW78657.1 hypothetical protein CHLRE_09g388100v5 [Chlamydomonas reinhardtii]